MADEILSQATGSPEAIDEVLATAPDDTAAIKAAAKVQYERRNVAHIAGYPARFACLPVTWEQLPEITRQGEIEYTRAAIAAYHQSRFGGDPGEKIEELKSELEGHKITWTHNEKQFRSMAARIAELEAEVAKLRKAIDLIAAMDTFAPGMMEAVQIAREARDAKP